MANKACLALDLGAESGLTLTGGIGTLILSTIVIGFAPV
jgi:hypothetical protein